MPNPFIPRDQVHAWSEQIGDNPQEHQAALSRLLKEQRRLSKFLEENAGSMEPATGPVALYLVGVIIRMFDLAGGRMRGATWEQVRGAEKRVGEAVPDLLPLDEGFPARVRAVAWRAQPHILDEALMALFEKERGEDEPELSDEELAKIVLLLWVAIEVLDQNWKPAKGFAGETEYRYVHIEPEKKGEG